MIKLGNRVRDHITGFSGVATGHAEYMYGCTRILIEPATLDRDGKPIDDRWFDEQRVEVVAEEAPQVSADSNATTGGPQNDPPRR